MKRETFLKHEFVEYIPKDVKAGTIYVSMTFATATHRCCCGCGNEVVTPISPTDWQLTFDGKSISLYPSIGNWSFDCRAHYWIIYGRVKWAPRWSQNKIKKVRDADRLAKEKYFSSAKVPPVNGANVGKDKSIKSRLKKKRWGWFV